MNRFRGAPSAPCGPGRSESDPNPRPVPDHLRRRLSRTIEVEFHHHFQLSHNSDVITISRRYWSIPLYLAIKGEGDFQTRRNCLRTCSQKACALNGREKLRDDKRAPRAIQSITSFPTQICKCRTSHRVLHRAEALNLMASSQYCLRQKGSEIQGRFGPWTRD
jgi:hypothetical protein